MQTRPVDSDLDGVSIVATLNKSTGPELVLLKQYRPALDKVVIEIPGGLIDPGESAEQCALRELKEETGFVGEVERISRTLFNCEYLNLYISLWELHLGFTRKRIDDLTAPGFCNNNFKLAYVNVDLSLPENQNPSPELEEEEFIEVFTLPIKSLFSDIKRLEKEGFAIETRVVALAEGLELARKWNLLLSIKMSSNTITVTLLQLAKMIDHSLLHPTMTDEDIVAGLRIARASNVATACVKPYLIPLAKKELAGSDVLVCPVIGFPHGNSTTEIKVIEATAAAKAGGDEIDMVVNVGKVLGGDWDYVKEEIRQINEAVVAHGAILKVIFENDYLQSEHIARLCEICTELKVAFVKTSTGYGFVKQKDGSYNYRGATVKDLKLMREKSGTDVQIKAAGGVRTLDDLLHVMSLGVTRIGATATVAILEEAKKRGIGNEPVEVSFKPMAEDGTGGY
ncbi:hypothetical protein APSETT445_001258 [Aspergillus pseudonomiae]